MSQCATVMYHMITAADEPALGKKISSTAPRPPAVPAVQGQRLQVCSAGPNKATHHTLVHKVISRISLQQIKSLNREQMPSTNMSRSGLH